jgi:ribosomal protein L37AE/L43A
MTEALDPCPFCAHTAHIERVGNNRQSTIYQCDMCGCTLETGEEWGHGRAWNKRVVKITDEMVERAAKALEKKVKQSKYEWTDDQFEIWWNKDSRFVSHETSWGDAFGRGTHKNRLLWETRIVLEAALS